MIAAKEALQRLQEGNRRFAANESAHETGNEAQRRQLLAGQEPIAVILGCSDSRVPAEIVFDQGIGDLFVIRVAGNVVAPSLVGSVEFACSKFGTRLVVVLGHTQCGAVQATFEALQHPDQSVSENIGAIAEFIRPSVESVLDNNRGDDAGTIVERAVRANIRASVGNLRHASDIIESLERDDGLLIVGAEYSLETGRVDFFDGMPW
jgi:carbonic anhydrase